MTTNWILSRASWGLELNDMKDDITTAIASSGYNNPSPFFNEYLMRLFGPELGPEMVSVFGCGPPGTNCHDQIGRYTVATQWVCSTLYAFKQSYGPENPMNVFYPVEFAEPNCNDDDGNKTKVCHGAEGGWVRGNKYSKSDFGKWTAKAYGEFYRNGVIPTDKDYTLSTWEELNYNDINQISESRWGAFGVRQADCAVLDKLQVAFDWYNWGITEGHEDSMNEVHTSNTWDNRPPDEAEDETEDQPEGDPEDVPEDDSGEEPVPEPIPTGIPSADPSLPDYNNLDYTFTCEDSDEVENKFQKCTLSVQSDPPMTFYGRARNRYVQFAPIPYAEPPVGDLRWKAPVLKTVYDAPVDGHLGGKDSDGNALMCTQNKGGQEDCLFLNIEVRQEVLENKQKVPILYYIHGGGFTGGTGMSATGKAAENQGVVAIGVNYRLGPWGFLYLNEKEDDQDWQGNWGLLDQQAGLKWIHSFAGLFGGDRDQVTLTGGSAGSESCWRQFTIPSSWPYFHRMAPVGIGLLTGIKSPHKIQVQFDKKIIYAIPMLVTDVVTKL